MEIATSLDAGVLTVALDGDLDTNSAPELQRVLNEQMPDATSVILDFTNLEYISSAGLRVLLAANKIMAKKGGMKIIGANESIREVFQLTNFSKIFNIEG